MEIGLFDSMDVSSSPVDDAIGDLFFSLTAHSRRICEVVFQAHVPNIADAPA